MTVAMKLKDACSSEKKKKTMTNLDSVLKSHRHHFVHKGPHSQKLWFFQSLCTDVRAGLQRRLSEEKLMLLNCGVGKGS